jgi:hypothetical protein
MTRSLWANYQITEFDRVFENEEDMDWGEFNVSFQGVAEWYITRRGVWQRNAATNAGDVASAPER